MNIEIANRLYQYRKSMGISQEELASRIGVSRQAVSKWERAEASPDTDNLIELSKIYGVTLDEMLQGSDEPSAKGQPENVSASAEESAEEGAGFFANDDEGNKVRIGFGGIHVHDQKGTKVDIDRHGIFVEENGEQKVYTDADGHIHKSDDVITAEQHRRHSVWAKLPYPIIVVIAYLLFGFFNVCGGWAFGWIIFLTVPLYYSVIEAVEKRDPAIFAYPVLAVIAFLILGFAGGWWHPAWVIFLTIPLYYGIIGAVRGSRKK